MEERCDFGVLKITKITRSPEYKTYEMQWTVSKYSKVVPDKLHTMHNIIIGKEACGFKLYKKSKDEAGIPLGFTELVVALSPTPKSTNVVFKMLEGGQELPHRTLGVNLYILEDEVQVCFLETPKLIEDDEFTISTDVAISSDLERGLSVFQPIEGPVSASGQLGNLLKNRKFSDIKIHVGCVVFDAHLALLCSRSEVFASMYMENQEERKKKGFRIDDFDSDAVEEMLNYIYTGKTRRLNVDLASSLFQLADKYKLPQLMEKAAAFLAKDLNMDGAMTTMALADIHNHQDLKDAATHFIAKNLMKAMQHRDWAQFQKKTHLFNHVLEHVAELTSQTIPPQNPDSSLSAD